MKNLLPKLAAIGAFVIGWYVFVGGFPPSFWVPFIFVVVASMGWGNTHLWGEKKDESA